MPYIFFAEIENGKFRPREEALSNTKTKIQKKGFWIAKLDENALGNNCKIKP